jgi:hypothetical protein
LASACRLLAPASPAQSFVATSSSSASARFALC